MRLVLANLYPGRWWLVCAAVFGLLACLAVSAWANDRYDAWQADWPYTLAGYGTHKYGGGGTLDIDDFLASGLNTAHGTRCIYNSERPMADVGDLPLIYLVYADELPDLEGFVADFERARKHYKNIVALQLGDDVINRWWHNDITHMRQIREWVVNHSDPGVRDLMLITCTPAGGNMGIEGDPIQEYMHDTHKTIRPDAKPARSTSWLSIRTPGVKRQAPS